jgi:sigma-E factor negative regulatory protein RseC
MTEIHSEDNCQINAFSQSGIISHIDNESIYVSIQTQSACSSCHSKGVCSVTEMKEKIIEIPREQNETFKIGDHVTVLMEKSMGTKAVLLGYIIPFFLLLMSLILSMEFFQSEIIAGILAIGLLAVYYISLYITRDKIKKKFRFSIR